MNPNQSTFESENLIVDYLAFKFQDLDNVNKTQIVTYLSNIGFNSYQESGKLAKPIQECLSFDPENQGEVCFGGDNAHWRGTLLTFSGRTASKFYFLVKDQRIDWTIFSSGILSRIDLKYSRAKKPDDSISIQDFLHQSLEELKQTKRKVSFEKNSKGSILKIGNRGGNLFYRIYSEESFVKFEHEMKGRFLQKYNLLLAENRLDEFEEQLCSHFFSYSAKNLPLHYSYMDWLLVKIRPMRTQQVSKKYLNLHYVYGNSLESFSDRKDFISLLKFLVYAKTLSFTPGYMGATKYRKVAFRLQDFAAHQMLDWDSENYYQVKKLKDFFEKLPQNSLIQIFSDNYFRSLVTIPEVDFKKDTKNAWVGTVWIAEELFYYTYPFTIPDLSDLTMTKDALEVYFKSIHTYSSVTLEKKFLIREFLETYRPNISNQQKKNVKQLFIDFVTSLQENDCIEANYQVISEGKSRPVKELTTANISEGFIIYEKLRL